LTWVCRGVEASFLGTVDVLLSLDLPGVEASFVGVVDRVLNWVCQGVDRKL
jgi:hypothetical protein